MMHIIRNFYIVFIFLTSNTFLNAQQSFQILFPVSNRSEKVWSVIEDEAGNFLSVGTQTKIEYPTEQGILWRISNTGDTLSRVFSFGDSTSTFSDIRQNEYGNYIVTGKIRGAPDFNDNLLVLKLNSDLQIESKKVTVLPEMQKSYAFKMIKHLQYYYILLGNYGPNSSPPYLHDPYFVKLNSDFDTVMTRRYYIDGDQYASDIIISPDGSQMWLFANSYCPEYTGASLAQMVIYDTLFNFVSVETFQDPRVDDNSKAKWLSDSTFLLGFQNINSNNHEQDIAFSEIDSTLLLKTVSVIGAPDTIDYMPANVGIDFVNPDSIHYAGTKNIIPEFWPQESSWIRVGLLDRNLEPLYERFYGGDAYYQTLSMMRTRDGGTFIAALRYNYLEHDDYNDAFFLKVNNEGLVTNMAMSPICPLESFIIYPNPGTDYINLMLSENSAKIKIFDMNRKEILSKTLLNGQNKLDCRKFKKGSYLISITDPKGRILNQKWVKQ